MIIFPTTPSILLEMLEKGTIQQRIPTELVYIIIQYSITLSERYDSGSELTYIITRYHQLGDHSISFAQALFKGLLTDNINSVRTQRLIKRFYRKLIFSNWVL